MQERISFDEPLEWPNNHYHLIRCLQEIIEKELNKYNEPPYREEPSTIEHYRNFSKVLSQKSGVPLKSIIRMFNDRGISLKEETP